MTGKSLAKNEKQHPLTRIRLVYHSECVQAEHLGLIVTAHGENDGPPFIIEGIVKSKLTKSASIHYRNTT